MSELLVVRHGQASLFADDYDQLSARGEAQAAALGQHWARVGRTPSEVITGPARRQRETARIAAEAAVAAGSEVWPAPRVIDAFDEHDSATMIKAALPRLADHDATTAALAAALSAAHGFDARSRAFQRLFEHVMNLWLRAELEGEVWESHAAFDHRVRAALDALLASGAASRTVALFTSAGPIAVLMQRALEAPLAVAFRTAWLVRNASVTAFRFAADRPLTLEAFNTLEHLPDPATWTHR
jgi:broad specificity phosphatase PhoE